MHRKFSDFCVALDGIGFALISGSADFYADGTVRRLSIDPIAVDEPHVELDHQELVSERTRLEQKYGENFQPHWCRATRAHIRREVIFQTIAEAVEAHFKDEVAADAALPPASSRDAASRFFTAR